MRNGFSPNQQNIKRGAAEHKWKTVEMLKAHSDVLSMFLERVWIETGNVKSYGLTPILSYFKMCPFISLEHKQDHIQ